MQILTGILFFASVHYYTIPGFKLKPIHAVHSVLPAVYIILYFIEQSNDVSFNIIQILLLFVVSLGYLSLAYWKIKQHKKNILKYSSNIQGIELRWLEYIIYMMATIAIVVLIFNIFTNAKYPNLLINLIQLVTIYVIAFQSMRQREIFPVRVGKEKDLEFISEDEEDNRLKKKLIVDDDLNAHKVSLEALMENQQPYLNSELNLVKLAEMLQITSHQLSYVINNGFNQNFYQFVNSYRVTKAKELLKLNNDKLSMLGIAFESGFNSKTSFNTTFKKMTQQTPSEFKKTCSNL